MSSAVTGRRYARRARVDRIVLAHAGSNAVGDLAKEHVADVMTLRVVQHLEMVKIYEKERTVAAVTRVAATCRSVRATGSAALGLAYVGAGWMDAYFHLMLMPWDVAAGALIIREAGGTLTTPAGGDWTLGEPAVVAGNGKMQARLLQELGLDEG